MANIHQIHAVTEDGGDVHFECRHDEDIITAALRQDIFLMSSCREGGCATCKALCTNGDYDLRACSVQALPPEEEEEGQVLLCRTYPSSDLELELPYTFDRISFEELGAFQAEVMALDQLSSNVVSLVLRLLPDAGGNRAIQFLPGQFMDLTIPGTDITRSYSPANVPNPEGRLEFLIRTLPDGAFSNYLRDDARVGQIIAGTGPKGVFGLKEHGLRPRYFVAGGTGLAPVMSMLRRMHDWKEPQQTRLYFGVTHQHEAFYVEELKAMESAMPNLTVRLCVWHAGDTWEGERGNAIDILRRDLAENPAKPDIYLCGPPGMVDAAHAVCAEFGIARDQVFLEKFLPSGPCGEACDPGRVHVHQHGATV